MYSDSGTHQPFSLTFPVSLVAEHRVCKVARDTVGMEGWVAWNQYNIGMLCIVCNNGYRRME